MGEFVHIGRAVDAASALEGGRRASAREPQRATMRSI